MNEYVERRRLWDDLVKYHTIMGSLPWVILGNFNVIRKVHEKVGGFSIWENDKEEFNDCCKKIQVEALDM